jgi:hypothetical protein
MRAVAHEEDRVNIVKIRTAAGRLSGGHLRLVRRDIGIGADVCVPQAGLVAEPFDHGQRMRDRIMLGDAVARIGPGQHDFPAGGSRAPSSSASLTAAPLSGAARSLLGQHQPEAAEGAQRQQLKSRSTHGRNLEIPDYEVAAHHPTSKR